MPSSSVTVTGKAAADGLGAVLADGAAVAVAGAVEADGEVVAPGAEQAATRAARMRMGTTARRRSKSGIDGISGSGNGPEGSRWTRTTPRFESCRRRGQVM